MCGRFQFSWDEDELAVQRLKTLMALKFPDQPLPEGEIFPAATVPVLVPGAGEKADLTLMRWGLFQTKGRLLINARSETAGEKPTFRDSLMQRRCVVLTTGFYEWKRTAEQKEKFLFRLPDRAALYLAGLYTPDEAGNRFVILTTAANASVSPVHDRMPVVLRQGELLGWLNDANAAKGLLVRPMPELRRIPA